MHNFGRRAFASSGVLLTYPCLRKLDTSETSSSGRFVHNLPKLSSNLCATCDGSYHSGYNWLDTCHRDVPDGKGIENLAGKLRAPRWPGPAARPGEKRYTRAQVQLHDGSNEDGSIWVTYKDGVYDVTHYVKEHPGGKFLLQAAGGPVDGWWRYWGQHHISKKVSDALERLRIGQLEDHEEEEDLEQIGEGVWEDEQTAVGRATSRRTSSVISEMPYQSETCNSHLCADFITPQEKLYVRNHAPVPSVDSADEHIMTFASGEDEVLELSLRELKERFSCKQITSTLQCTGNRAADNIVQNGFKSSGFTGADSEHIGCGMLGNASWRGPRLNEVLLSVLPELNRMSTSDIGDLHVRFEGLDGYYTSIPLALALDPKADCLLAVGVNGEDLSPDHGFPVRALLPGIAGARSVKWLSKISIVKGDDSPWTASFYLANSEYSARSPIYRLPMNSLVLSPEPGSWLDAKTEWLSVKGVAYPGGTQRRITKVEVSADRGQNWQIARCLFSELPVDDAEGAPKSWVRFETSVKLPAVGTGAMGSGRCAGAPLTEIWCRAYDDDGNVQPARGEAHGGYQYNGYHRVPIVRSLGGPPLAAPGEPV
eukprot:TRINITY_DN19131_c0_g1_i1.p1 TRINITY_DN19131_c0_g1~~TRINITY_DN19131_c0_g1_i1.p1  ORF type:complete len:596 (-),score=57.83 TRINITY_DN19131_c0_g1_i1:54-1841(-)